MDSPDMLHKALNLSNIVKGRGAETAGVTHYWHTGIGGAIEPWKKTSEGWEKIIVPAGYQHQPESVKHKTAESLRADFVHFTDNKLNLFTEEEQKAFEQLRNHVKYLEPDETVKGVKAYTKMSAELQKMKSDRKNKFLGLLRVHNPATIEVPELSKSLLSRRKGLPDQAAVAKRVSTLTKSIGIMSQFIDKSVQDGLAKKAVFDVGTHSHYSPDGLVGPSRDRADYGSPAVIVAHSKESSVEGSEDDVYHEYAHHLREHNPAVKEKVKKFYEKRTSGEKEAYEKSDLVGEYTYKKDKWKELGGRDYTGRIYKGNPSESSDGVGMEVLSCGMERFMDNPLKFAKQDPEFFNLVLSCLRGTD